MLSTLRPLTRFLLIVIGLAIVAASMGWDIWHFRQHMRECPPDAQCWMLYEGCQAERAALRGEARR